MAHPIGRVGVLEGPGGLMIEQSLIFKFKVSNNQAKYEALLVGLELARDLGAERVECRTDSQLVEGHMKGTFQIKDDQLLQYVHKAKQLKAFFEFVEIRHVPRKENSRADMFSKLASGKEKGHLSSVIRQVLEKPTVECFAISSSGMKTGWTGEIIQLIKEQDEGGSLRVADTKKIAGYCLVGDDLYRRGYTTPLLKCLEGEEAEYVVRELHVGICGRHTGGRALRARILRAGYFWPTLEEDCMAFSQKCLACQKYGNVFHAPASELHNIVSPWSFAQWGMNIVGPFPVERAFGIPKTIVTDNGRKFIDKKLMNFYKELDISAVTSSVEHPQTNGQAEATNNIIVQELKKRLGPAKEGWVDELDQVLWGYRCSPHGSIGESSFNLIYGSDAMLPVEVGEPTVRRMANDMDANEECLRKDLDVLEKRRRVAVVKNEAKKRLVAQRNSTKVRPRQFAEGDLVCRKTADARKKPEEGKLVANWDDPYIIREALQNGAHRL
ncbi:uncharacterized protein LOC106780585 [Vigna radiata var. radiata]|uniref:Uncharacterized protein LOC106780585 n=1 Tax=Vigna radiata var. radiata TaxID=3916 RepID=A0A1S3W1B3_VIGRR|nr:uncharacterized protein LOC106780585 [Vigna radiata var. radiata]